MLIITEDKICEICFTTEPEATWYEGFSQSPDSKLSSRIRSIYEMMNGDKFTEEKVLPFMKKAAPAPKPADSADPNQKLIITDPKRVQEMIKVEQMPIVGFFAYYRYYILQKSQKYKSILKFNLDHERYFEKRDEIMEVVNNPEFSDYWKACILSQIV